MRTALSQCAWANGIHIIAVAAGERHSVGVMKHQARGDSRGQQLWSMRHSGLVRHHCAVAAGHMHTVGLPAGRLRGGCGDNDMGACNVDGWRDIVAIAAGNSFTVGGPAGRHRGGCGGQHLSRMLTYPC